MRRALLLLVAALALAGCGGGGGGSSSGGVSQPPAAPVPPSPPPSPPPVANTVAVTLDGGQANPGDPPISSNRAFVSVTLCAPGSTTNCQTIDHVVLDTASVGLRILAPALNPALLAALPAESDHFGNPVGECFQFVNSFMFGSVRTADFSIAGEKVASMPFQAVADAGAFATVPADCSSSGGDNLTTAPSLGGNGILGVATTTTDCLSFCTVDGGKAGPAYYDCPSVGCGAIIGRAANAAPPFEQLPNPVAAFPVDNNGLVLTIPDVPKIGATLVTGMLTFGIATQADNVVTGVKVLPLTTSQNRLGPANLTATYNGKQLTQSFLDTGSPTYFFIDPNIPICTPAGFTTFYCPVAPILLSPLLTATNGATASGAFTLFSPFDSSDSAVVVPGVGQNSTLVKPPLPLGNSFDFGLPFFFGKTVYVAIEGRRAGSVTGPFLAF
jgi:hypothetical protein